MDLQKRYAIDRARLGLLSRGDAPAGEYASPVFGDGNPHAAAMLIGEAPGAEETRQGRPFVGRAGRYLDLLLEQAGIERAGVYTTNVVKYRPVVRSERSVRNRTPGPREIAAALPLLADELTAKDAVEQALRTIKGDKFKVEHCKLYSLVPEGDERRCADDYSMKDCKRFNTLRFHRGRGARA